MDAQDFESIDEMVGMFFDVIEKSEKHWLAYYALVKATALVMYGTDMDSGRERTGEEAAANVANGIKACYQDLNSAIPTVEIISKVRKGEK
jgi:hypothetical protein